MRAIGAVTAISLCLGMTACSDVDAGSEVGQADLPPEIEDAYASTADVFDIHPDDRPELEERALGGDPEASFRLAQYYSLSGTGAASDAAYERQWLELAAQQGHRTGKHNLAVLVANEDCPRAVAMMQELIESATTPEEARGAASWLEDPSFQC